MRCLTRCVLSWEPSRRCKDRLLAGRSDNSMAKCEHCGTTTTKRSKLSAKEKPTSSTVSRAQSRFGAAIRSLRLPDHRSRRRERDANLLLRQLRARKWRKQSARSQVMRASATTWGEVSFIELFKHCSLTIMRRQLAVVVVAVRAGERGIKKKETQHDRTSTNHVS